MNYGLIMGILLVVLSLVTYLLGVIKPPFWVNLIKYAIMIGVIVWGTKNIAMRYWVAQLPMVMLWVLV